MDDADEPQILRPGHVIGIDGRQYPGQVKDPHIRAYLIARVHELRHGYRYSHKRIQATLGEEGHYVSRGTVYNFLKLGCDQCDGGEVTS